MLINIIFYNLKIKNNFLDNGRTGANKTEILLFLIKTFKNNFFLEFRQLKYICRVDIYLHFFFQYNVFVLYIYDHAQKLRHKR
jgi:hypothetical protein